MGGGIGLVLAAVFVSWGLIFWLHDAAEKDGLIKPEPRRPAPTHHGDDTDDWGMWVLYLVVAIVGTVALVAFLTAGPPGQ